MNNTENNEIWVFLSHSNADFEKVRVLRNKMEEKGLRPLMFFLKCLEKDDEVFELLKREIDVRPRFFLCQSENAIGSKWVQKEVAYIKSKNRPYEVVNLNDEESFDLAIARLIKRTFVLIIGSDNYGLENKLIQNGFHAKNIDENTPVYLQMGMTKEQYREMRRYKIYDALRIGYCLFLIRDNNYWEMEGIVDSEYTVPVVLAEEIPTELLRFKNLLHIPNIQEKGLEELIVSHLIKIDLRKNCTNTQ